MLGKYIGVFGTNPDNEAKTPIATAPVVTQGKGKRESAHAREGKGRARERGTGREIETGKCN